MPDVPEGVLALYLNRKECQMLCLAVEMLLLRLDPAVLTRDEERRFRTHWADGAATASRGVLWSLHTALREHQMALERTRDT